MWTSSTKGLPLISYSVQMDYNLWIYLFKNMLICEYLSLRIYVCEYAIAGYVRKFMKHYLFDIEEVDELSDLVRAACNVFWSMSTSLKIQSNHKHCNNTKLSDRQVWANSVHRDHTAPSEGDVGREFLVTTLDANTIDDGYGTTLDSPSKQWWMHIHYLKNYVIKHRWI